MATPLRIITGDSGPDISMLAAASALHSAAVGRRTLLFGVGPAGPLGALLGAVVGGEPGEVAPRLDALALDALAEAGALWQQGRAQMPAQLAGVSPDELPLLPGSDLLFGFGRLRELAPRYEQVIVDAGPYDGLLRALALPDGLRWGVRLLFGLDRGPGASAASLGRALLPVALLPQEVTGGAQELRIEAARLVAALTDPAHAAARVLLRPDRAGLEGARLAVAALQLHGLAVDALLIGPLVPSDVRDERLRPLAEAQAVAAREAQTIWPNLPSARFFLPESADQAAIARIGAQTALAGAPAPPIGQSFDGAPALTVALPGLPPGALGLTLSGDELVVRVGPYRRHLLLPEALRGTSAIKATREGELLVVRRR